MKVLIVTNVLRTIHCDLILNIEDLGYRILIREIGPVLQTIQTVQTSPSSPSMEAMDSNEGVLGFEDIEDEVASADVARDDSRRLNTVATEDKDDNEEVKVTEDVSNEGKQANGSPGDSLISTTRTKSVNFSQNGYSEEIFKISQHAPSLGLGAAYQQPAQHACQPPGFGSIANDHANVGIDGIAFPQLEDGDSTAHQLEEELPRPPGFDSPKRHDHSELLVDPACESQPLSIASPIQLAITAPETLELNKKAKTTFKKKPVPSKRILTRRRKMLQSSSKSTDDSNKTSEGTRQLAREALEIGKILGLAVIDKEDAAIKTITTSLKKEKKARAQERADG